MACAAAAQQRLTVYFDFDRYELNDDTRKTLNSWIAENDHIEVAKLYGFCDWKGSNRYNDSLSVQRVRTVLDYLTSHNIKVAQGYEIKGFGEDFNQSKIQAENRKVIIVYDINKPEPKTSEPPGLQQRLKATATGNTIRLDRIEFFNMSARIVPQSKAVLYELLCAMQDNPNLKIEIQGHICCQLNGDLNNISTRRAQAVYNYLVQNKINRKRLSYKGYGVTRPIHPIPEQSVAEENENRRVEVLVVAQ